MKYGITPTIIEKDDGKEENEKGKDISLAYFAPYCFNRVELLSEESIKV